MKVVFRADASLQIGTGHMMRCLTLADALRANGGQCWFICREHPGHLIDLVRARGYPVCALPASRTEGDLAIGDSDSRTAHHAWLGVAQNEDADACLPIMQEIRPDWLIVDHYALDIRWEDSLRPFCGSLMVIDDLADRRHECDLLLDQNWFGRETDTRYDALLPRDSVKLLGPQFALLRPEYAQLRALMPPYDGHVGRVLVFLGGSDLSNLTAEVLRGLMQDGIGHLIVDVVVGMNHPDPKGIASLVNMRPATTLHENLESLAGLMARADLMISGGGVANWERMSLGVPGIVYSLAENQLATNMALMRAGYINLIHNTNEPVQVSIVAAVCDLMAWPSRLVVQSALMRELVPGNGVSRVCELICPTGSIYATAKTN